MLFRVREHRLAHTTWTEVGVAAVAFLSRCSVYTREAMHSMQRVSIVTIHALCPIVHRCVSMQVISAMGQLGDREAQIASIKGPTAVMS